MTTNIDKRETEREILHVCVYIYIYTYFFFNVNFDKSIVILHFLILFIFGKFQDISRSTTIM